MLNIRSKALVTIVLAAAGARLLPHPPNFTPLVAMALFGGAYFANKRAAFAVPLAAMLLSDVVLGLVLYGSAAFSGIPFVYASFAVIVGFGILLRRKRSLYRTTTAVVASALVFFIITNLGVWLRGHLYPRDMQGLVACYLAAVPFLKNTLASAAAYSALLFGGFALAEHYVPVLRELVPAPQHPDTK